MKDTHKKTSEREDLDHQPANAGKVGSTHKALNQKGEQPRDREPKDDKAHSAE